MSWKNMKVKQKWEWVPEELPESTEELENPARGWLEIYTFQAENGINPLELRWSLRTGETLALVLINGSIPPIPVIIYFPAAPDMTISRLTWDTAM